ncbi:nuclear envelope pore membrane protein POM 121C-like isoform X2 [Dipodomys spectabilis]|uniref:nuclear envelope pore membrane protein POM 121C-like isoform X2 n=1 Tax=Dipodomys spectabilis TaxID=105255 RepID=UPI001C534B3A|nr:nuclear envelope pore membrane protein POM 121C-like isoform X2 [Dipodomys spectabilis]
MSPAAGVGERRRPISSAGEGRGRLRGGPAGALLLGLALLGLVLCLVPAAAALAWLAVGATAAWWGLTREPRGPRASSARFARRPRTLLVTPPSKAAANGGVPESRSLLEGPDPAELLLMGSYLGKPGPPPPPAPDRLGLRPPPSARSPPPGPRLHPVRSPLSTQLLGPSRRPFQRDSGSSSNRFVITPRRRYPIQQAQYSLLGVLPTVCWNGCHKKTVLSARNSRMVCSPVTVRIAPPNSKLMRSPVPEQVVNAALSSPTRNAPDPCAKETVLNALKERKKRAVEEEDQIFADGQENKRRRHDSSGSGHSAFEPLVANGIPASFVPKPGSLKRGLTSQSTDDHLNKRSRTSSVSSLTSTCTGGILSSSRNAITSSYSSSRGVSQLWKRSGPTSSPFSSPASSRSQTPERPAKKTREDVPCHHSSSSPPLVTDTESQGERDVATRTKQGPSPSPATPNTSGKRKRKTPLLPSRRGDQLTLPPPPQLGYSITAEDLDMEKKASLQWFNKALEDATDNSSTSVTETPPASAQPSFTFSLPAVAPASSAASPSASLLASPLASLPAPSANPLLESLQKMQGPPVLPAFPEPVRPAASSAPSPPKTASPGPTPPAATFPELAPAKDTKSPLASVPELPVTTQGAPVPSPTPKSSVLGGVPSSSLPSPVAASSSTSISSSSTTMAATTATAATATVAATTAAAMAAPAPATVASPMFKPIFLATPKSEGTGPSPPVLSDDSTAAQAFKPIFGSMGLPASVSSAPPFLKPTTTATTTTAAAAPAFASLPTATTTSSTTSSSVDSVAKPVFGFVTPSAASTTGTEPGTCSSQPFLFGATPASASSFPTPGGPVFQFGKAPTPLTPAPSTFGQLPSSATALPASSSGSTGFSGFGSGLTTSATATATTSQPSLTFSTTTPTFNIPFGSGTKAALPPYPGASTQPAFGATEGQPPGTTKPALAPSFGSAFTFGTSAAPAAVPAPTPAPAPAAFGTSVLPAFGALKGTASAFGAPASTQPAFGSTTTVFSFGTATTQTTSTGTTSSVFGSSTPAPFTFGSSGTPAGSGGFGIGVATPSSSSGAFAFGAGQGGTTGTSTAFSGGLSQNTLGTAGQNTSFVFNVAGTPESKPVFGGTSTPTFGQSTLAPGVGSAGSSLSFGTSSTPTQGFTGVGPFGSATPSFSIGAGSKTPGARQRLQARRQHTRKK